MNPLQKLFPDIVLLLLPLIGFLKLRKEAVKGEGADVQKWIMAERTSLLLFLLLSLASLILHVFSPAVWDRCFWILIALLLLLGVLIAIADKKRTGAGQ